MTNNLPKTEEKALINATDKQLFKPSANQEKWLDVAIQTMSKEITVIAEGCGLDRSNWYKWIQDPEFVAWYTQEWDRRLKAHAPKLDVIGMKMAERDSRVLELMMKRVGTLKEAGNTNNIQVVVPILNELKAE